MKFIPSQLAYLTTDREARGNLRALGKYLAFLAGLIAVYAVVFHIIKLNVEPEQHSWVTGLYWTLVVMTTLGFGDITFTSDIGRVFSIIVLLSGVVFLLVMLPFLFIRLFYAPWLEARVRLRAPREVRSERAATSSSPSTTRSPPVSSTVFTQEFLTSCSSLIQAAPASCSATASRVLAGENDKRRPTSARRAGRPTGAGQL